jgi:catechol 2,3-dioxygenase-like lactoylglutathione lyase family enzyme
MTAIQIASLDHLVLTVRDLATTIRFYVDGLGMRVDTFAPGRTALYFGTQKLNLHEAGHEFDPKAQLPTPGSADLCFLTATPLAAVIEHLQVQGIAIEEGPIQRSGAQGPINSVYCRDPDGNLVEIANQLSAG